MKLNFAAPCLFGLESLVADELRQMAAEAVTAILRVITAASDKAVNLFIEIPPYYFIVPAPQAF